ncbi:DsrE family protein [candidate division WOR-3 bacterium]|nr:DsrE family protein [candidate division WOR-3 bacterium]
MNEPKKVIILVRAAPYGMASAAEGFRVIIGLTGMGLDTHAVLVDDGVLVSLKGQAPSDLGMHKLEDAYSQLQDFGARLYVHTPSLEERGILEEDCIGVEPIDDDELGNMISTADHIITF